MATRSQPAMRRAQRAEDPNRGKGVVKSAARVLEILEYFDDIRREANVVEISSALNYPQSSTSALLRSLVKLGYLKHEPFRRTYVTSNRVTLLGHWASPEVYRQGPLIEMMNDITAFSGDAAILATRRGLYAQYVHVVQATVPARLHLTIGTMRPLAASGTGLALLSTLRDPEITRLINRINAEALSEEEKINPRSAMEVVQKMRTQGYTLCCNMISRGGATLSVVLPKMGDEAPMVLAIGGIAEVMLRREAELAGFLMDRVKQYADSLHGPHRLTLA